ncbi:nucleoside triphosphate pyrophosphatase [Bacillus sp. 03113]|uniref:Maf family protein n=1 Tax=Bacillus sp. 03113 TaxID=2578211 RepID=UPI0011426ACD|nr:Maf family protein [Bacillus sp. 03113]
MQDLILASSSPRRKELLAHLQHSFKVISSDVDETFNPSLSPEEIVIELAARKANDIFQQHPTSFVIGADTLVVNSGKILGKPKDRQEAFRMLKDLSGKSHSVFTGVCICSPDQFIRFYEKTDVVFWDLSDEEIDAYIRSGEPFDKAGAYGIQGLGSLFVQKIEGDYFNVVGLPISKTFRKLKEAGFKLPY